MKQTITDAFIAIAITVIIGSLLYGFIVFAIDRQEEADYQECMNDYPLLLKEKLVSQDDFLNYLDFCKFKNNKQQE
jgi:hypothetical protein